MDPPLASPSLRLPLSLLELATDDIIRQKEQIQLDARDLRMTKHYIQKVLLLLKQITPDDSDSCPAASQEAQPLWMSCYDLRPSDIHHPTMHDLEAGNAIHDCTDQHDMCMQALDRKFSAGSQKQNEEEKEKKEEKDEGNKAGQHRTMWQEILLNMFKSIAEDESKGLARDEFLSATRSLRVPDHPAIKIWNKFTANQDGYIESSEWMRVIELSTSSELEVFAHIIETNAKRELSPHYKPWYILSCLSVVRLSWDMIIAILLLYIAVAYPYMQGFGSKSDLNGMSGIIIDVFFVVDMCLNFHTSFLSSTGTEVFQWGKVAKQYLKTWFAIDFISCLPLDILVLGFGDAITQSSLTKLDAVKVLKFGKLARTVKLAKFESEIILPSNTYLAELLDDMRASSIPIKLATILISAVLLCHWLACGMAMSGTRCFERSLEQDSQSGFSLYLAALYWAMTTMTTVGYGDITPTTDWERSFTMLAMVIGGIYYGYVIGQIITIVTTSDDFVQAYYQRMRLITAWIKHHQFPDHLRKKVIFYFRAYLSEKSAIDDVAIMNDLPDALREECRKYVIHNHVRDNLMLQGLSNSVLRSVVQKLQLVMAEQQDYITRFGRSGTAMYVISQGAALLCGPSPLESSSLNTAMENDAATRVEKVRKTLLQDLVLLSSSLLAKRKQVNTLELGDGDSFGEEILVGITSVYEYSVVAQTKCAMNVLLQADFDALFGNMPEVKAMMYANLTGKCDLKQAVHHGQSTCKAHHITNAIPHGFVHTVLNELEEIKAKL